MRDILLSDSDKLDYLKSFAPTIDCDLLIDDDNHVCFLQRMYDDNNMPVVRYKPDNCCFLPINTVLTTLSNAVAYNETKAEKLNVYSIKLLNSKNRMYV